MVKNMRKNNIIILILSLLVILLAVSLAALACMLHKETEDRNHDYYTGKCESFAVQNANLAKGQIVFIGDSITDLYVLDDHYSDLGLAVYNRGIGGDTTDGVLRRLEVSVFDLMPSYVVLMIGTNDVNGRVDNDIIARRYTEIIDEIYTALPDVKLYCMSVIPQNEQLEQYSTINVAESTKRILELNTMIEEVAVSKGAIYLDLFSRLSDGNNRLKREYSDDGIHLNNEGLSVWTELIKPYLAE
jgi:lysophospholipase L1-like esterase